MVGLDNYAEYFPRINTVVSDGNGVGNQCTRVTGTEWTIHFGEVCKCASNYMQAMVGENTGPQKMPYFVFVEQ